jgi:ABC-2 type transport system permease protein
MKNKEVNSNVFILRLSLFKKYSHLLYNLVKKDFTVKYRRSYLGILWSLLNPLLMMIIIASVFNNVFRIKIENYAVFYLTGSFIYNFMAEATSGAMNSIIVSGELIKKVYIPKYIFPIEKCLFAVINAMFSFCAVIIVTPLLGVKLTFAALLFFVPLIYTTIFSFGLGMLLASLNVFFRDITHLYTVWITAWMYLTPILYPIESLPENVLGFVRINPMVYFVDYFRQLVFYGKIPGFSLNLICILYAVSFFAIGLLVFKKTQNRFILFL